MPPRPPPPSAGREHLCFTLMLRAASSADGDAVDDDAANDAGALHLVASSTAEIEAWVLGLQPFCADLTPADRISQATLRWRSLRLRVLRHRGAVAE